MHQWSLIYFLLHMVLSSRQFSESSLGDHNYFPLLINNLIHVVFIICIVDKMELEVLNFLMSQIMSCVAYYFTGILLVDFFSFLPY